ncbi:DUF4268 domain-containing protein [Nostoc sp.]|uniref:DUF4268 domain-containing protein n=1 Tax=Nostoc sp. TaxID=1180 RepID=UPI002FFC5528
MADNFKDLQDPRGKQGVFHPFISIVMIGLLTTIGGATGWEDIETYGVSHHSWPSSFLQLSFEILSADTYAVLIVDSERHIAGIVTSYDTTEYFCKYAEDIMLVEDIENTIKDYILADFTNESGIDQTRLNQSIEKITPSNKELKNKFKQAVTNYLKNSTENNKINNDLIENVCNQYFPQKKQEKPFDKLTLSEYTDLFLHTSRWNKYSSIFSLAPTAIRKLLNAVRGTRNDLAHFRGEISSQQREQLRFCKDWLSRHQSAVIDYFKIGANEVIQKNDHESEALNANKTSTISEILPADETISLNRSRYAPLALLLQNQTFAQNKLQLTFQEIEEIIGDQLPASARRHRSWWANDSVSHPQSQQWLNVGWRVATINMNEESVIFTGIEEQEKAYINFFSTLLAELSKSSDFPVKELSQDGRYLATVAGVPMKGSPVANLTFTFTPDKKFRVELYIDKGTLQQNKNIFDALYLRRDKIETSLEESLTWERMDKRNTSRIALYRTGAITDTEQELKELQDWAVAAMLKFHKVMEKSVSEVLKLLLVA